MSDDSQLTVAELLSRSQRENPQGEKKRSGRRRSMEEGGVSVAELTGSLEKVNARPAESKHSSVPIDAEPEAEAKPEATPEPTAPTPVADDDTSVLEKVEVPDNNKPDNNKPAPAPQAAAAPARTWSKVEQPVADPSLETTGEIPVVGEQATNTPAETSLEPAHDDEFSPSEESDHAGEINPILLVVLIFVGLLLGIAGFLGFQWVWANVPTVGAIAAAVVVIDLIVVGVHALKTARDTLTMVLAGLAGLVVTFGPWLITAF